MDKNTINRSIFDNAEYIISYYNERKRNVTHLMLEKLLYFLEAIYIVRTDEVCLYKEEFTAFDFGPVNQEIYKVYKKFGNLPIILKKNVSIPPENLIYIEKLYETFGNFTTFELVALSHSEGSPWYKINKAHNGSIPKDELINKKDTKTWFSSIVTIEDE